MHQMGFTESDAAVEEQRVEMHGRGFCDPLCRRMGEFVGLADNKMFEGETRVERGAQVVENVVAPRGRFRRRRHFRCQRLADPSSRRCFPRLAQDRNVERSNFRIVVGP